MSSKTDLYWGDADSRIYIETNEDFAAVLDLSILDCHVIIDDGYVTVVFDGKMDNYSNLTMRMKDISEFKLTEDDIEITVPKGNYSYDNIIEKFKR